jgi:uncharacterized repeat protein (TIGR01451 family)/LPXTG-motif cell wall-anchored protein
MSTRTRRTATASLAAGTGLALVLTVVGTSTAQAAPGHPGTPDAAPVVFHEDFEKAPDTGLRTMLDAYVGASGHTYTADPYWIDNLMDNGMVLSGGNTRAAKDGSAANNGTEAVAFATLKQLAYAIGKVNGSDPAKNTVISAYTQSTGKAPAGNKVMFQTAQDIELRDSHGRFLAFSMSAAATNAAAEKPGVGREDPQYVFSVAQGGTETPLSVTPVNPVTDPRAQVVAVPDNGGTTSKVYAGQFASDQSFLYESGTFGIVIRNLTSAHMGNDGAFDDIKVLDVTPQLDKQFGQAEATTGQSVRLTFTVTNTAELANKKGWSFTDSLPAGLVVASDPGVVVDGTATVTAAPGADAITVSNGDLEAGDDALTISLNVTSATAGTYSNGPANITVRRGLDSPDTTTVTFTDPAPVPSDLVVRHVDESGTKLVEPQTQTGEVGGRYETSAQVIPGYELVSVPANATGTFATETTVVVYVYRAIPAPKDGDLVVRYVDEDGTEVAGSDRSSGTLVEGTTEVVYVYTKTPVAPAPADLTVRWVTEDGRELADPYGYTGVVDETYTTEQKAFDGYTLVAVPVNATGALAATPTEVVYVYKPNPVVPAPADLTVRYVDESGNPVADPTHRDGELGEPYTTDAKTVDGYELVAVPANASGEMAVGTEVVYVYRKVTPAVPTTPTTPATPTPYVSQVLAADSPAATAAGGLASTGAEARTTGLLAAALATAGGLLVVLRRRKAQHR